MKTLVQIIQVILIAMVLFIASAWFLTALASPPPIRVGVIDTGLDLRDSRFTAHLCPNGHADFSGEGLTDYNGHGTHIAGLIQTYARDSNYCLVIVKYWCKGAGNFLNEAHFVAALQYVLAIGVDVVNVSVAGPDFNLRERSLLAAYPKVQVLGAAGNDSSGEAHYPCGYALPNLLCVGAVDANGNVAHYSNRGVWVGAWERGDMISTLPDGRIGVIKGTSQAVAAHTGKLIYSLDSRRH